MTNFESIKNMSMEELAKFLCRGNYSCGRCVYETDKEKCKAELDMYKNWLESERKDDNKEN